MTGYIIRRLLLTVPVCWAALSVLFLIFYVLPGDPVEAFAGQSGRAIPEETRQAIVQNNGLDDPLHTQYVDYWKRTLSGDLGESYATHRDVSSVLSQTYPNSLRLAIWAIAIQTLFGISAGLISAVKRYSFVDSLTTVVTAVGSSLPVFVLGYLMQQSFGVYPNQHGFPEWARMDVQGTPEDWFLFFIPTGDGWRQLLLPAVVLAFAGTALVTRMMRTTMLEVNRADFMRTARAKGLAERQIVLGHGLRNAVIPVVTVIGLNLADLIGSAILTETVFSWNGMGRQIALGVLRRDAPLVLGLTLVLVVGYVVINLIVDVSYGLFDPRVRVGGKGTGT